MVQSALLIDNVLCIEHLSMLIQGRVSATYLYEGSQTTTICPTSGMAANVCKLCIAMGCPCKGIYCLGIATCRCTCESITDCIGLHIYWPMSQCKMCALNRSEASAKVAGCQKDNVRQ